MKSVWGDWTCYIQSLGFETDKPHTQEPLNNPPLIYLPQPRCLSSFKSCRFAKEAGQQHAHVFWGWATTPDSSCPFTWTAHSLCGQFYQIRHSRWTHLFSTVLCLAKSGQRFSGRECSQHSVGIDPGGDQLCRKKNNKNSETKISNSKPETLLEKLRHKVFLFHLIWLSLSTCSPRACNRANCSITVIQLLGGLFSPPGNCLSNLVFVTKSLPIKFVSFLSMHWTRLPYSERLQWRTVSGAEKRLMKAFMVRAQLRGRTKCSQQFLE